MSVRRSLRLRILAATGLAFVGLGLVVCLLLPQSFQQQARGHLRERTEVLTRGVAHQLAREHASTGELDLAAVSGWLASEPELEAAVLLAANGDVLAGWPGPTGDWGFPVPDQPTIIERTDHFLAIAPFAFDAEGGVAAVGLRTTTDGLRSELAGVLWLFVSILLLTCAGFVVLSTYLTRGILDPLEEIRRATMELADGEPRVTMPVSGDLEIDELGSFIAALGSKRRHSTLLQNPFARRPSPAPEQRAPDPPPRKAGHR